MILEESWVLSGQEDVELMTHVLNKCFQFLLIRKSIPVKNDIINQRILVGSMDQSKYLSNLLKICNNLVFAAWNIMKFYFFIFW